MPHPEHAVEDLTGAPSTDGRGFFTSILKKLGERMSLDTVEDGPQRHPRRAAAVRRAGHEDRRVRAGPRDPRPPAHRAPSWPSTRSCGASTAPTSPPRCTCASSATKAPQVGGAARRHGRERRRRGHRRRLGRHLQDRVAQPPVLRRAPPGRGDRRRRHRPRHHVDGRAAGRGHGRAALRRARTPPTPGGCCPASSRASATTATASACPTSAARSSSTPATSATRWSTRSASACSRKDQIKLAIAPGPGQQGRAVRRAAPAPTASAARRCSPRPRSRTSRRPSGPAVQVGDPFMEKLLIECCLELYAGRRRRRHPGPRRRRASPARRPSSPPRAPAAWTSTSTSSRCATRRCGPRRS